MKKKILIILFFMVLVNLLFAVENEIIQYKVFSTSRDGHYIFMQLEFKYLEPLPSENQDFIKSFIESTLKVNLMELMETLDFSQISNYLISEDEKQKLNNDFIELYNQKLNSDESRSLYNEYIDMKSIEIYVTFFSRK